MNLIEIAEDLKDVPDQYLMQEIQQPTGNFPAYLVVSELSRRKRMREKVAKEMPTQTVAEELATPPQPQMTQGMSQGLMGMPQAQTELAAQDAMGTTPPEMMMPQMAGGGMVSFKQGGDVIRAANGLPEEMYEYVPRSSLDPYVAPGTPLPNTVGVLRRLGETFPTTGRLFGMEEDRLYIDPVTKEPITYQEFLRKYPQSAAETRRLQSPRSTTPAVAPGAAPAADVATAGAPAGAPAGVPSGVPGAAPVARSTIPIPQFKSSPALLTAEELRSAGRTGEEEYARTAPYRLGFMGNELAKRAGALEGRRDSNINEALIQAGLGIMGSKSPRFLGAVSEGGTAGLNAYRQGMRDIRQSEDALLESRAKMAQAEMLYDQNKLGAAQRARAEAISLNELGIKKADSDNAQMVRQMNAQIAALKAPAEIGVLESQSYALRNRPVGLDKTIATPDQIAQARIRAMTELASGGVKNPSQARIDAEIDSILAQSGLRRAGGIAGLPAAGTASGAKFLGFEN